mgnify:FL=1
MQKISNILPSGFKLSEDGTTRISDTSYLTAIREALVNCLVHGDYKLNGKFLIEYKDKSIEFTNPGTLRVSEDEYYSGKANSNPRNHRIANMFRFIGLAEEAGTGVVKILSFAKEKHFTRPIIDTNSYSTKLTIKMLSDYDKINLEFDLTEEEKKVLHIICSNIFVKRPDIEKALKLNKKGALNVLNKLIEMNIITKVGRSTATMYLLTNKYYDENERIINLIEDTLNSIKKHIKSN